MAITVRENALYVTAILINFFHFAHIFFTTHLTLKTRGSFNQSFIILLNGQLFQTVYLFPFFYKKRFFF